jgi:RNA polymerase sigma-70 factor (ECF subfamily)
LELKQHHPSDPSDLADDGARPTFDIAALTRQLVAGDDMAYRTFHEAYCVRLSRYLLVVTAGNEEAMREALQETYRRVAKHVRVFSDEAVFWSWLTVLARSAFVDEGRKRRRYLAFLDRFRHHAAIAPAMWDGDPLGEALERNLACLPVDERSLLESKYFERQSVSAIASQLQTTEKAIESRLTRIRQKLKAAVLADLIHEPHP